MLHILRIPIFSGIKQAMSLSLTVLSAALINYFYGFSQTTWMIVAAFFIAYRMHNAPLREGLIVFIVIAIALIISYTSFAYLNVFYFPLFFVVGIFIAAAAYNYQQRFYQEKKFSLAILFAIALVVTVFTPSDSTLQLFDQCCDVAIGSFIGFIFARFVFPSQTASNFQQGLLPLINVMTDYSEQLTLCLTQNTFQQADLSQQRANIENAFTANRSVYPEWVYHTGFNPGLRGGYRYFLINLEWIVDLLMVIEAQLQNNFPKLSDDMALAFKTSMQNNTELLRILNNFCKKNQIHVPRHDLTSDISILEKTLQMVLPKNIELLTFADTHIVLAAVVDAVRGIRQLLLKLIMTLPPPKEI